ncbi:MAG: hypothetical protein IJI10_00720 [Eubacterium sp.]|nr:hypothetical protein [Eubacterium sp.]
MKGTRIRCFLTVMALTGVLTLTAGCGSSAGTTEASSADSAQVQETSSAGSAQIQGTSSAAAASEEAGAASSTSVTEAAESTTEQESSVGMANPWSETEDLEEAAAGSGIRLEAPMEGLPEHDGSPMNFWKYLWMDDVIEARYENINDEMIIRASSGREKQDLSGDYTEYSKTWTEYFKGVEVECMGDGETVNLAYFDSNDIHFSIGYQMGDEGRGLTVDELSSLIMGMYAEKAGTTE